MMTNIQHFYVIFSCNVLHTIFLLRKKVLILDNTRSNFVPQIHNYGTKSSSDNISHPMYVPSDIAPPLDTIRTSRVRYPSWLYERELERQRKRTNKWERKRGMREEQRKGGWEERGEERIRETERRKVAVATRAKCFSGHEHECTVTVFHVGIVCAQVLTAAHYRSIHSVLCTMRTCGHVASERKRGKACHQTRLPKLIGSRANSLASDRRISFRGPNLYDNVPQESLSMTDSTESFR